MGVFLRGVFCGAIAALGVCAAIGRLSERNPKSTAAPADYAPAMGHGQKDGSLVLERRPGVGARPAHSVPKGASVERIVQVVVKPRLAIGALQVGLPSQYASQRPEPKITASATSPIENNAPVTIDLTLVRMPDGGRRVIASSPDGETIGGVDVPVGAPAATAKPLRHAAGISLGAGHGAWYQCSLGRRFIVGASLGVGPRDIVDGRRGLDAGLLFGLRW